MCCLLVWEWGSLVARWQYMSVAHTTSPFIILYNVSYAYSYFLIKSNFNLLHLPRLHLTPVTVSDPPTELDLSTHGFTDLSIADFSNSPKCRNIPLSKPLHPTNSLSRHSTIHHAIRSLHIP